MKNVQWHPDRQVRTDVYAFRLVDGDGKVLARVCDSTNTFRKAGDYSMMAGAEVTLSGEGQWADLRSILVRLFSDHDLSELTLPARSAPQNLVPDGYR